MKIILAPDSFKGALDSPGVCAALARGIASQWPDAEIVSLPMADGGEGTTRALVAATGGTLVSANVHGPLGETVTAHYGMSGKTAVLEMASAAGIEYLPPDRLDPMRATTFGVGELMLRALDAGAEELVMGIGGSATVDGGAGMLQALGIRFLDACAGVLPDGIGGGGLCHIATLDATHFDARILKTKIRVACDVTNPLLGANGAAAVFAPQKGATPEQVKTLEENLHHWREIVRAECCDMPGDGSAAGDGAAGGLGFALRTLCHAQIVSGAHLLIDAVNLRAHLAGAGLLITGEGRTDAQTAHGKLCGEIAHVAHEHNVPVILVSGALDDAVRPGDTFDAAFSIARGPSTLADAISQTRQNLEHMGANIGALLRIGGV